MLDETLGAEFDKDFLTLENNDWQACLSGSLVSLHNSWSTGWIGLRQVIEELLDWLQHEQVLSKESLSEDAALMLEIALHVADLIEAEALKDKATVDHPYHNRLHFAQVVTGVGIEYSIQSLETPDESGEWLACLLLSAIGHDYKHTGDVNRRPMEIEMLSVQALLPVFHQLGLPSKWEKTVTQVILNTDVPTSREVHARVKDRPFSWCIDWASVLLTESDHMASASKSLGPGLGQALSIEWLEIGSPPDLHVATNEGRQRYLRSLVFSSHASRVLGLGRSVEEQLALLSSPTKNIHA